MKKINIILFILLFILFLSCSGPENGEIVPNPPRAPEDILVMNPEFAPARYELIRIEWSESSGAEQYGIFRKSAELTEEYYTLIGVNDSTVFEDRTATININYTYAIKAFNFGGSSNFSVSSNFIELPEPLPSNINFNTEPDVGLSDLSFPESIKIHNNNLYIADFNNYRIIKIDIETTDTMWLGWDGTTTGWHIMSNNSYLPGTDFGQFSKPMDIYIDNFGIMYIVDTDNNRIQKIMPDGTFSAWLGFDGSTTGWHTDTPSSASGNGNGEFTSPSGVALDSDGYVYVADMGNNRIQKISNNGNYIEQWGGTGTNPGEFNGIIKIFIKDDILYAADEGNNRIQKFENNTWYVLNSDVTTWVTAGDTYSNSVTTGTGDSQFLNPRGITVDNNGYIYVADTGNFRVQVFKPNGNLLGWLGVLDDGSIFPQGWFTPGTGNAYNSGTLIDAPVQAVMESKHNLLFVSCYTYPGRVAVFSRNIF